MDVERMREHCLAKPGAWPDFPWDHEYPVVKVGPGERGKIFAFLAADSVGVKGGPSREAADEWLARFPDDATVMRYIGRSGWNTLAFGGAIPDDDLFDAVDESYRLVVAKLRKSDRPVRGGMTEKRRSFFVSISQIQDPDRVDERALRHLLTVQPRDVGVASTKMTKKTKRTWTMNTERVARPVASRASRRRR